MLQEKAYDLIEPGFSTSNTGVQAPYKVKRSRSQAQAFRKKCLLDNLDDIGVTLCRADKIKAFET